MSSERQTMKEALATFLENNKLNDGGYDDDYFKIKIGTIYLCLPNVEARKKGVKIHDLHHILTNSDTNWRGEVKVAVWELWTGCKDSWTGWFLNSCAVFIGFFIFPSAIFEGIRLAKQSKTNLYYAKESYTELLEMSVDDLKKRVFQS